MALSGQLLEAGTANNSEALIQVGDVVDKLIRFLADKKSFPNPKINHFMGQVVDEALGTEEQSPTSPWLIIAIDNEDSGLNTSVNIDTHNNYNYLILSAGFCRLKSADPETAKTAIGGFIYQATIWFTHGRRYGPTMGPREDWAESRKQSFLETIEQKGKLLNDFLEICP